MTQPSLTQTFDTSLVDLGSQRQTTGDSFSSLSSTIPSESGTQPTEAMTTHARAAETQDPAPISSPPQASSQALPYSVFTNARGIPTHYLPTAAAYDQWAHVYDTDSNILQAVDDIELYTLLPDLQRLIQPGASGRIKLIDLGCGTGRNTAKLLRMTWPATPVLITGYDVSNGMLAIAQAKLEAVSREAQVQASVSFHLQQHDFLNSSDPTATPVFPSDLEEDVRADALISTLVLEHFPLEPYFAVIRGLVKVGAFVLITNMHSDMGLVSQAGFERQDPETGEVVKVRGCSWAHGSEEIVQAAERSGFETVEVRGKQTRETAVDEKMLAQGLVSERGRKWVGKRVWFGVILRRVR